MSSTLWVQFEILAEGALLSSHGKNVSLDLPLTCVHNLCFKTYLLVSWPFDIEAQLCSSRPFISSGANFHALKSWETLSSLHNIILFSFRLVLVSWSLLLVIFDL